VYYTKNDNDNDIVFTLPYDRRNHNNNNVIIIYNQAVDGGATKAEFAAPHLSPTCACHT
jgi:hypothetical protein